MCSAGSAEQQKAPGNFKNPSAVKEVLNGRRTVANAAWWGFDGTDSTRAIQSAINSGAGKVIIPYMGKEWVVRPIKLASNQEIVFEPGVVVIAKKGAFQDKYDRMFLARDLSNITLRGYGAVLRMRKADYVNSSYTISEYRHIFHFMGCNNITILGLRLENSGGDGICLGASWKATQAPCKNVLIKDCISDGNYRQGISVISVDKLLIENCVLKNTRGTAPQSGIDIEPNNSRDMLVNVVISNCISEDNAGAGFITSISGLSARSRDVSILFVNCQVRNCATSGLLALCFDEDGPKGLIEFKNCICENTGYSGAFAYWKLVSPIRLRFSDCKWWNVARDKGTTPIRLDLKRKDDVSQTGGVEFTNCYVYDERNRPFLRIPNAKVGEGTYNIKGDINIYNPYGARIDPPSIEKELALKINSFKMRQ